MDPKRIIAFCRRDPQGFQTNLADFLEDNGVDTSVASQAASRCCRAVTVGAVEGGTVGTLLGLFASRYAGGLAAIPGAVLGVYGGAAYTALSSESCSEVRELAKDVVVGR
jgi:uncharacterized membrane protein